MKPAIKAISYFPHVAIVIFSKLKCMVCAAQTCLHVARNCIEPLEQGSVLRFETFHDVPNRLTTSIRHRVEAGQAIGDDGASS